MRDPSFGVVLLNWNGFRDTEAALDSLIDADPKPAHVIVVDNGSRDDSLERLRHWAIASGVDWSMVETENDTSTDVPADAALGEQRQPPWLLIIDAKTNRGFAVGNNIALTYLAEQTPVTHFLLLNNDATVARDYFARLHDALKLAPGAGLMGSAIYYEHDHTQVWYAGGYEIPYRALVLHAYDVPSDHQPVPTPFVTGCAMLIARVLYDRFGGLNPCYTPIYWEDTDYSRQTVDAGIPVYWAPAAKVYHKVGASVGGEQITPQVAYWQNRHRGYYVRRNYRGADRIAAIAYLCLTKPGRSVAELLRGRPAMGRAIFRGFAHGVFGRIP